MDAEKLYAADQRQQQLERNPAECFSGEVSSRDGAEDASNPPAGTGRGGGGSSINETGKKRARGRPPGSKNKPKQQKQAVFMPEAEPAAAAAMRPYILEIPGGGDISGALAGFARRRGLGVCVLAGTGAVADVSLRRPSPNAAEAGAAIVFRGRHEILSVSATYLPPSVSAAVPRALGGLTVSLAGPHGQILGGAVIGPLVAATTVVLVAATFTDPTFHRLSADDVDAPASVSGSGEADKHHGLQLEPHQAGRSQPHSMAAAAQPVSLYAGQSHVARAPAASKPRPRPPNE